MAAAGDILPLAAVFPLVGWPLLEFLDLERRRFSNAHHHPHANDTIRTRLGRQHRKWLM